jgi:hypothetical protein
MYLLNVGRVKMRVVNVPGVEVSSLFQAGQLKKHITQQTENTQKAFMYTNVPNIFQIGEVEMFDLLVMIAVVGLVFGVAYPLFCCLVYPIYKLLGGKDSFRNYIKNI